MTEYGIHYPSQLSGAQLDAFLAKGWYRMGQGIFTTNYVIQEDQFFRVFWLRYDLYKLTLGKTAQSIISRNQTFTCIIKPAFIDAEIEELYALYKSALVFEPAASVRSWLLENATESIYETWMVEVRHGDLLIAAGFFDLGDSGLAGILNCYHPSYKKYSPGKYLMLKKIAFARSQGMQWYYPGYIVKDYHRFDYKLFVDKNAAELFLPEGNAWHAYRDDLMTGAT